MDAVKRAVRSGFQSLNVDLMFALPGQTLEDWKTDVDVMLELGVDQVSTYPLFSFPYSELGVSQRITKVTRPSGKSVRQFLDYTHEKCLESGLERCAVWSWLRPKKFKFSSITRHHYVGFGPSAASMTGDSFYVNTFDVEAYSQRLKEGRPIALAMPMDKRLEMAYWLYWRIYELEIKNTSFKKSFGPSMSIEEEFGFFFNPLRAMGMVNKTGDGY
jgi:oxygen-independent coproporphyrinogen-3 oxidase